MKISKFQTLNCNKFVFVVKKKKKKKVIFLSTSNIFTKTRKEFKIFLKGKGCIFFLIILLNLLIKKLGKYEIEK